MSSLSADRCYRIRFCTKCKVQLPVPRNPKEYRCVACHRLSDAKRRKDRSGKDVDRNNTEAARARKLRWAKANPDPVKHSAHLVVRRAIKSGKLKRPDTCEVCGSAAMRRDGVSAIQGHHADYSKPLDVKWLCPPCHEQEHAALSGASGTTK